jgi:hypothetical protein
VNANPSGSRTPPTGGWGRSKPRRELAKTTGPPRDPARVDLCAEFLGATDRWGRAAWGGTRHTKKACRGALIVRRAAQGRTGDLLSRQVCRHLALHPLLLANTSAPADAVRRPIAGRARARTVVMVPPTAEAAASRPQAQRIHGFSPHQEAHDAELVPLGRAAHRAPANGHSRGKGVLAA